MDLVLLGAADYPRIMALWQRAGLSIRPQGRDSREAFAEQLAGGIQIVLGLQEAGDLVGVIVVTHDSRKGWLNRLAIDPRYRRQGLGLQLIRAAEDHLQGRGIQVIAALIEDNNDASRALFAKAGYADHTGIHYLSKRPGPEA
jgi:ribosomal protein S18 acetylase RimI-like enzyme